MLLCINIKKLFHYWLLVSKGFLFSVDWMAEETIFCLVGHNESLFNQYLQSATILRLANNLNFHYYSKYINNFLLIYFPPSLPNGGFLHELPLTAFSFQKLQIWCNREGQHFIKCYGHILLLLLKLHLTFFTTLIPQVINN